MTKLSRIQFNLIKFRGVILIYLINFILEIKKNIKTICPLRGIIELNLKSKQI